MGLGTARPACDRRHRESRPREAVGPRDGRPTPRARWRRAPAPGRHPPDGVREDGIYVEFAPFHRSFRRIPFSDLADVQETGYGPLRYGGWGIRWSPSGVAYTASGRSGVRFERTDGKSTFVGSDRPDELVAAVQEASSQTV
ncbi:hypothetical protein [Halorussus sp. MSC15.2]|uniref:hypothetical protein n=1 Tax=Halorussus sp. MSC15.2 TaxID=2283638 RepID=UPI0013D0024B|nr:hypothetical protein [Halorussus sp. MSC15.2]NEU56403.1 hypothetical protein [Halorussus sp. MSC15.2]